MNKLTWLQFLNICKQNKDSKFLPPNWTKVEYDVASILDVQNDSKLHDSLLPLRDKYFKHQKKNHLKDSSQRETNDIFVLNRQDLNACPAPPKKCKTKSLDQLTSDKQLQHRTDDLWNEVCKFSENDKCGVPWVIF